MNDRCLAKHKLLRPVQVSIIVAIALWLHACQLTPEKDMIVLPDSPGTERFNEMSASRVAELHRALIGREFVFRIDWFMHYIIGENALVNRYFQPGKKRQK